MTLGAAPTQGDLLRSTVPLCQGRVAEDSIYAVLHRECFNLFPDSMFADLFTDVGRRSVPPMTTGRTRTSPVFAESGAVNVAIVGESKEILVGSRGLRPS